MLPRLREGLPGPTSEGSDDHADAAVHLPREEGPVCHVPVVGGARLLAPEYPTLSHVETWKTVACFYLRDSSTDHAGHLREPQPRPLPLAAESPGDPESQPWPPMAGETSRVGPAQPSHQRGRSGSAAEGSVFPGVLLRPEPADSARGGDSGGAACPRSAGLPSRNRAPRGSAALN